MRATYSPEDNKLRIYPVERLDEVTYARVKEAGYKWAPKQELFVAPMWTPERAELAIDLCGFIGDEDTTLVERATEKAERLEDLSERRANEAERTYEAVANRGLVVGSHSRAKAEKEAKKLEQKMKRADSLWDEADYWKDRAKGAIRLAKYKERQDVRHRRIKGIEADKRKNEKGTAEANKFLKYWEKPDLDFTLAKQVANYDHISRCFKLADFPRDLPASQYEGSMSLWSALDGGVINEKQAAEIAIRAHNRDIARSQKWHDHYENRLAYERAMLDEQGGVISDRYDIKVGGKVLDRGTWLVVLKVNKSMGKVSSVTTQPPPHVTWCSRYKVAVEAIQGYEEPTEEVAAAAKAATKKPPICNFSGEGFHEMTKAEWDKQYNKVLRTVGATDEHGAYRCRVYPIAYYKALRVFITDAKVVMPPTPAATIAPTLPTPGYMERRPIVGREAPDARREALKQAIKSGVQVVSANQLFPTPKALAERMVEILDIQVGDRVLEPSAGTGRLLSACGGKMFKDGTEKDQVVAVEINHTLARNLQSEFPLTSVLCKDFLQCNGDLGKFDKILMNPPFEKGDDIKHIKHALTYLKPGGVMVAICANGSRQSDQLKPLVGEWEDLPPNTFAEAGTGVNTALLTFYA